MDKHKKIGKSQTDWVDGMLDWCRAGLQDNKRSIKFQQPLRPKFMKMMMTISRNQQNSKE